MSDIAGGALEREPRRGPAHLLILPLLDARPRLRLEQVVETRSGGELKAHVDSLYPLLSRLQERGWIKATWIEKPGDRRRRFYEVMPHERRVPARQRRTWEAFVEAVRRVTGGEHA